MTIADLLRARAARTRPKPEPNPLVEFMDEVTRLLAPTPAPPSPPPSADRVKRDPNGLIPGDFV